MSTVVRGRVAYVSLTRKGDEPFLRCQRYSAGFYGSSRLAHTNLDRTPDTALIRYGVLCGERFSKQYDSADGKDTLVITHVGRSTLSAPDKTGTENESRLNSMIEFGIELAIFPAVNTTNRVRTRSNQYASHVSHQLDQLATRRVQINMMRQNAH